jgi:spore germination protein YaaH
MNSHGRAVLALTMCLALPGRAPAAGLQRHFYATADEESVASLRQHARDIDLASPQWFQVDASGRLVDVSDPVLADWARRTKVRLMPLVLNSEFRPEIAHLVLSDSRVQSDLIRDLLDAGERLKLRGFQLDFENVPASDRAAFTAFVRALSGRLRSRGLRLSVAVPAPLFAVPSDANPEPLNERALAFDYRALSAASDFLTVMTYDQHTSKDNPGPVSGRPWLEACLKRVLAEAPAKKVMLGLPLYYRRFRPGGVLEGTHAEALALSRAQNATIRRDPVEGESTFAFDETGAPNVVWLQDAQSLKDRLDLTRRLRLLGFSAWRLGHEDPEAWPHLSGRK